MCQEPPLPFSPSQIWNLDRPACNARLFNNLSAWPSLSERAMPRFGRGSSAAVVGRGVRGEGAPASTAVAAPSFLGGYLVFQASILRATYFLQVECRGHAGPRREYVRVSTFAAMTAVTTRTVASSHGTVRMTSLS
jgi:hypothetical protein